MLTPRLCLLLVLLFAAPLGASDVICIHGFMRKSSCMKKLGKQLESVGHTAHLWGYSGHRKTIEQLADDLVADLCQIASGEPIHFVTHSLGGLIVRAAINHPDCPPEAKEGQIIMMAPPNGGSRTARFLSHCPPVRALFGSGAGRQLMKFHQEDVEALGPLPQTIIIAGKRDWKVSIAETRPLSPHTHHIVPSGHCFIMRNRQAWNLITNSLASQKTD